MRDACADTLQAGALALNLAVDDLQLGVVPYNGKALTVLPDDRRLSFEAHLRRIAKEGFAIDNPDIHTSKYIRMAIDLPEASITDAACATCMGYCCKAGGPSWGFMDETTVCRFRVANPDANADDFRAYYLDHLPETSVEDNCVFQSGTGCTLKREDRADLCNSFLCRGVNRILQEQSSGAKATAIIAQHEGIPKSVGLFDAKTEKLGPILPVDCSA